MPNRRGQGRKPKPTEIKIAQGTDRPDRRGGPQPKVHYERPRCPSHLDKRAKAEWKRICGILEGMGVLSPVYAPALELYCESYSKWRSAVEMVDRLGQAIVKRDSNGQDEVRRNPFSVEAHKYKDECLRFLTEFGLTPSAKSRIVVENETNDNDAWEQFIKGGRAS